MNENPIKNDMFQPMYMYLLVGFSFIFILFLFIIIIEVYVKYKLSKRKGVKRQHASKSGHCIQPIDLEYAEINEMHANLKKK